MKKIFACLFLFLLFSTPCLAQVGGSQSLLCAGGDVGGVTCNTEYYSHATSDSNYNIMNSSNNGFLGVIHYHATNDQDICKVTFYLTKEAGDISSKSYHAEVWSVSGYTADLGTQQGSDSDSISGDNTWSGTAVTFTFPATITLSGGTYYVIVITEENSPDGSNYANLAYENNTGSACDATYGLTYQQYQTDGTFHTRDNDDCVEVNLYEP